MEEEDHEEDGDGRVQVPGALMPSDGLLTCAVSAVQYINPEDGSVEFAVLYEGDAPLTQFLGLMELAKMEIHSNWREDRGQ